MRGSRGLGKCRMPAALLLGLLPLGDAEAKNQLPLKPTLEDAVKLLNSSSGKFLPDAVVKVRLAIGDLDNQQLFTPGSAPGGTFTPAVPLAPLPRVNGVEKFILEPPGGLYVLHNRAKVKKALKLLQAAEAQLNAQISKTGPGNKRRAARNAVQNLKDAIKDVKEFLRQPFIF